VHCHPGRTKVQAPDLTVSYSKQGTYPRTGASELLLEEGANSKMCLNPRELVSLWYRDSLAGRR